MQDSGKYWNKGKLLHEKVSVYYFIKRQSYRHIKTSQMICSENQLTGFSMIATLVAFKELMLFDTVRREYQEKVKLNNKIVSVHEINNHFYLNPIWLGSLGVRFEVGGVKLPRLKLVRIMLETWHLVRKYTHTHT